MMNLRLDRYRDVVLRIGGSAVVAAGPRSEAGPVAD
jgi:hypothetical protein